MIDSFRNIQVSKANSVKDTSPKDATFADFLNSLCNVQHLPKPGSDNSKFKKKLPVYLLAGRFEKVNEEGIVSCSGLLPLDLDFKHRTDLTPEAIKKRMNQVWHEALAHDKFQPIAIYRTFSGEGLRLIYYCSELTIESYTPTLKNLSKQLERDFRVEFDGCYDVSRRWFCCYDPKAYISDHLISLPKDMVMEKEAVVVNNTILSDKPTVSNAVALFIEDIGTYLDENCIEGAKHNTLLEAGNKASAYIAENLISPTVIFEYFDNYIDQIDSVEDIDAAKKTVRNGIDHGVKQYNRDKANLYIKKCRAIQETEAQSSFRTANQRLKDASKLPPSRKLLSSLVFENEQTIFFADTGVGKSAFIVAWADAITKGKRFLGLECEIKNPVVQIVDFELSDQQFYKRYSSDIGIYSFSDNLHIDSFELPAEDFESTEYAEKVIDKLKASIEKVNPDIVVIDNISYISNQNPKESQTAGYLLKKFRELRDEYKITVIVIAHTPKIDTRQKLTINHLSGTKQFSNLSDAVFALGRSQTDKNLRYIKQLKCRSDENHFETEVLVSRLKKDDNILTYDLVGLEDEAGHLSQEDDDPRKETAIELRRRGKSIRKIADELNLAHSTVGRWLKGIDPKPEYGTIN
jgi:DNA-binding NarL/FixJ family response regulator